MLLFGIVLLLILHKASTTCPKQCICTQNVIKCSGKKLTHIPENISPNTIRLELQENSISIIRKEDFADLRHLKVLHLTDNNIQIIEQHAFDPLINLERIRLNRNRIRALPDGIFQYNRKLRRIDLSENYLSVLTDEQLRGPKRINNLQLDKNFLTCLDTQTISTWTELEILTLNKNNLSSLNELHELPKLRTLRLADNMWLCDCRLRWMQRLLNDFDKNFKKDLPRCMKPAHLHMKRIDIMREQDLKCSGIEKRAAKTCRETSVCPPMCICTDSLVDCKDRGLTHIPLNIPASAQEIRLGGNQITYVPSRIFQHHQLLIDLDLSSNNIVDIAPDAFQGLLSLKSLILYKNNLSELHPNTFRDLRNLTMLLLNSNRLRCIWKDTFKNLTSLTLLSLFQNEIKSIAEGTFDNLPQLHTIHLGKNPLICDCNLEWLIRLLSKRPMETSGAVCSFPKEIAGLSLLSAKSHSKRLFDCEGSQRLVTARAGECIIDYDCPPECVCKDTVIDCSGVGLTNFPREIPSFVTELRLSNNQITALHIITKHDRLDNLEKLILRKNRISTIEIGAFKGLKKLRELDLSGNQLKFFGSFHLGSTALVIQKLVLNNNFMECLTSSNFANLSSLKFLDLSYNRIKCITSGTFSQLPNLRSLSLSHNDFICDCHIADLARYLSVNQTKVKDKPTCAAPRLLSGRPLATLRKNELTCRSAGKSVCADNGNYCPADCHCQDSIVKCDRKGLKEFPVGIPSDTTHLSLVHNEIFEIPKQELNRLSNLIKLELSYNRIAAIENETFVNLKKLEMLLLNDNKIQCLEEMAFAGLRNLKILSLYRNDLSVLPETAFEDLSSLKNIVVLNNTLYCDCKMAWFSRWLNKNYLDWGMLRCDLPLQMRNQILLSAQEHQFTCDDKVPQSILAKCSPCLEKPCKNGGQCVSGRGRAFTCKCKAGFHGEKCEDEIDACYGQPCLNNATCLGLQYGRFQCQCLKGFRGDRCEVNIDDCVNHKCKNGGICIDRVNAYECKCFPTYAGKYCETKLEYCTEQMNPCQNGGKCLRQSDSYKCICSAGFTDPNCTTNIDDCQNNTCKNNAICIDGINSYTCRCSEGYSGKFCELAPIAHYLHQKISPCQANICGHGVCVERDEELSCHCREGYRGTRCEQLRAVGLQEANAYVELEPWDTNPEGNLTLVVRTNAKIGIIAYYGVESHFSAELFDGRVKIAFFAGNDRASHMYSYGIVSDNLPHRVEVIIIGNALSLRIDDWLPQKVENTGPKRKFSVEQKCGLYLGGLPGEVAETAKTKFHVISSESFRGCISDVYVNGEFVDLEKTPRLENVQRGCSQSIDLCYGVKCQNDGECVITEKNERGYECKCKTGFKGAFCERKKVHCSKQKFLDYYHEGNCRSIQKIKQGRCVGWCGNGRQCCHATKIKPKKVRLRCYNGRTLVRKINIVRKCRCGTSPKCAKL